MKYGVVMVSLVLAGCSTIDRSRPTMEADATEAGYEGAVLIRELAQAYDFNTRDPGCRALPPSYQERDKESVRSLSRLYGGIEGVGKEFGCSGYRQFDTEDKGKAAALHHLNAGVALSDLYCDNYFRRISMHYQKRRFGQGVANDAGTAASAGLGLASAGSIVTGAAGALFGLIDGAFRNYNDSFVVEPDLKKVFDLVRKAQDQSKVAYAAAPPVNFFEARSQITRYAQLCSYVGMSLLVNKTLDKGIAASSMVDESMLEFVTAKGAFQKAKAERDLANKEKEIASTNKLRELEKKPAEDQPATDQ